MWGTFAGGCANIPQSKRPHKKRSAGEDSGLPRRVGIVLLILFALEAEEQREAARPVVGPARIVVPIISVIRVVVARVAPVTAVDDPPAVMVAVVFTIAVTVAMIAVAIAVACFGWRRGETKSGGSDECENECFHIVNLFICFDAALGQLFKNSPSQTGATSCTY
jgi:hypothetical protein